MCQIHVSIVCNYLFIHVYTHSLAPTTVYDKYLKWPLKSLFTSPPLPHIAFERVDAICVMTHWRRWGCDDDGIPQWDGPTLQMATRCNFSISSSLISSPATRKKAYTSSASQAALRWVSWVVLARDAVFFGVFWGLIWGVRPPLATTTTTDTETGLGWGEMSKTLHMSSKTSPRFWVLCYLLGLIYIWPLTGIEMRPFSSVFVGYFARTPVSETAAARLTDWQTERERLTTVHHGNQLYAIGIAIKRPRLSRKWDKTL